jgi:hypothetical protein
MVIWDQQKTSAIVRELLGRKSNKKKEDTAFL